MSDEWTREWLDGLLPRIRAVVERVGSGASASEYTIAVRRLRGRRIRLRIVADLVEDDEEVFVSEPHDATTDTDAGGRPMRKARRIRRI